MTSKVKQMRGNAFTRHSDPTAKKMGTLLFSVILMQAILVAVTVAIVYFIFISENYSGGFLFIIPLQIIIFIMTIAVSPKIHKIQSLSVSNDSEGMRKAERQVITYIFAFYVLFLAVATALIYYL